MFYKKLVSFSMFYFLTSSAIAQPFDHPMASGSKGMVVDCQPLAVNIGIEILKKGGNAADAFIATTLAEYVTAYGYTSLSGPLNMLYFDAKANASKYLNAGNNKVGDPKAQFDVKNPVPGQSYVIGGASAGLYELYKKYGSHKLTFAQLTTPAEKLARNGFTISSIFAWTINNRFPLFTKSKAWNSIYTKNGKPLVEGDTLYQPEFAETLKQYGRKGSKFLFKGKFSKDLIATINANGGHLTPEDLSNYKVIWAEPLSAGYRNFVVQTGSYRSHGGLQLLYSLKAIENFDFASAPHYSKDEATFETVLRTYMFAMVAAQKHSHFSNRLDDIESMKAFVNGTLAGDPTPNQLWSSVQNKNIPLPGSQQIGGHSCDPVVIDKEGNIATGNETINSHQWGDYGLIVDGVALNSAYVVSGDSPPGERAMDPLMPVLIFKNGKPWVAAGFFASSLQASGFEVLLNLMDYKMNPKEAIMSPRFGTAFGYNPLVLPFDQRLPLTWIDDFAKNGITLSPPRTATGAVNPKGYVDTGDAMVIQIDPDTRVRYGSPSEMLIESTAVAE